MVKLILSVRNSNIQYRHDSGRTRRLELCIPEMQKLVVRDNIGN
jgi:hypothetical protein